MRRLGVELKLEPTGKYFPVTDQARTVLDALLRRVEQVGVKLLAGTRVAEIRVVNNNFELTITDGHVLRTKRLIVATGGLSLPKSGSDGAGLEMLRGLGHSIVPTTPALSPLVLRSGGGPGGSFADLSGLTLNFRLGLSGPRGRLAEFNDSLVFTH